MDACTVLHVDRALFTEVQLTTGMGASETASQPISRRQAALAVSPFLALGLADVILLLAWGVNPLWGFMILPPILFVTVLGWIAFRTGFARYRTD